MKPLYLRSSGSFKRLLLLLHRPPPIARHQATPAGGRRRCRHQGIPGGAGFPAAQQQQAGVALLLVRGGPPHDGRLPRAQLGGPRRVLGGVPRRAPRRARRGREAPAGRVGVRAPGAGLFGGAGHGGPRAPPQRVQPPRVLRRPRPLPRLRLLTPRLRRRQPPRCLAPEYYTHGIVDEKTDVFAFGVFLLELVTGRRPVDGSHRSLLSWARPLLSDGKIEALVDPRLGGDYDGEQARRVAFVASLCVRAPATWRASMTEVLELLEGGEIRQDRWAMPEEAAGDEEQPWWFDDLDDDDSEEDEGEEFSTPSPSSSSSTTSNEKRSILQKKC
ncbi:unnamed protein product [Miscanthus lutarioriparius]|uniref:Serine-threonine/tyrosine-protein kinase catalytic domain-containing protein n=1 Tax=Miscanthus lutarioriparius TaxID=422564 RepID=A0A811SBY1_9POAL|nr:unnamed protein product [Miscanthus lutarioriparius]